ncbi:MAG: ACT domain-containing protein [Clostridia bacterium]|nr:ACT domain-containing protein [Clostridia bacterium]MBQ9599125.1 ACT domain-containing protein [Clostridia bacterium]MBR0088707.1 ACT domain-containing protein [Clostridia bacterium]
MKIKVLHQDFSVCKVADYTQTDMNKEFVFTGNTDEENSLVCPTEAVPQNTTDRDDGWRGMRIEGTLDFSLIGILAKISAILADNKIGIFVVSTYNTDYVLTKAENFEKAVTLLKENGYKITE